MRRVDRWGIFKVIPLSNGKLEKIPLQARDIKRGASSTDPSTWCDFDKAVAKLLSLGGGYELAFALGDGFVGFDIDGCRDPRTGRITPDALVKIDALNSFTETSVSGRGVHVIAFGDPLPPSGRKKGPYELYDGQRFFVVTGLHVPGTPTRVERRSDQIADLHRQVFGPSEVVDGASSFDPRDAELNTVFQPGDLPRTVDHLNDDDLIDRARSASNGAKFSNLWSGNWQGLYTSQSEADCGLCSILAFWTQRNAPRIDMLFRRSGLMRAKWDARRGQTTYGAQTIQRAIAINSDVFEPSCPDYLLDENQIVPLEPETSGLDIDVDSAEPENL